jgi:hypothetical protein
MSVNIDTHSTTKDKITMRDAFRAIDTSNTGIITMD